MSPHAVALDLSNPNTSHAQVVDLVGEGRRVLDVGCGTGDLGAVLTSRGCRVSGVEADEAAAAAAADVLERVVVADPAAGPLSAHFEAGSFDVLVLVDVLDHLEDPVGVLRDARSLLAGGGRVVVSVPNVTHGSVRLALLQGRWDAARSRVHCYDRAGLLAVLAEAGLVVDDLRGTLVDPLVDPLGAGVEVDAEALPQDVVEWVRDQEDAFVDRFQLSAAPGEPGSGSAGPRLREATALREVRPRDAHAVAREQRQREALLMKDHVIGLQATATSAEVRLEKVLARVERMRERLDARTTRVEQLRRRVAGLERELEEERRRGLRPRLKRAARRILG